MRFIRLFALVLATMACAAPASGDSYFSQFVDPKDGKLDMSQYLAGRTGFLPVPIIVSGG